MKANKSVKRPALRYHGGKWKLAPWIISYFPDHRVYVEPYGGAASVLLRKERSYAEIYNDMDGEIVNLFRVLRDPVQVRELARLLRLTPYARSEFEVSYLTSGDPIEQARRTVIRSFMGFSSLLTGTWTTGFRSNSNRSGSTPVHDWRNYPEALEGIIERLRGVVIENRPASQVMLTHDTKATLNYIDPPYPAGTRHERWSGNAYRYEMSDNDHREMARVLHGLQGMVVVSGYPCELYDIELFPTWQRIQRDAYADGASKRTEVLWLSPNTTKALQQTKLQLVLFRDEEIQNA
jgi:DNA adenine methylase